MLNGFSAGRIWLCTQPTDMRCSFDGLSARVRRYLGEDPTSGQWFVFINRRRTMLKILAFDTGGYWIWSKRLEQGQFALGRGAKEAKRELNRTALLALVEGIDTKILRQTAHGPGHAPSTSALVYALFADGRARTVRAAADRLTASSLAPSPTPSTQSWTVHRGRTDGVTERRTSQGAYAFEVAVHARRGKGEVTKVRGEPGPCRAVPGAKSGIVRLVRRDHVLDIRLGRGGEASASVGAIDRAEPAHDLPLDRLRVAVVSIAVVGRAAMLGRHGQAAPRLGLGRTGKCQRGDRGEDARCDGAAGGYGAGHGSSVLPARSARRLSAMRAADAFTESRARCA